MYQYSLAWFIDLFVRGIAESEKSTSAIAHRDPQRPLHVPACTPTSAARSSRRTSSLFSFSCAVKIMQGDKLIDADEWRFFLSGSSARASTEKNPAPSWLTERVWGALTSIAKLPAFVFKQAFAAEPPRLAGVLRPYDTTRSACPASGTRSSTPSRRCACCAASAPTRWCPACRIRRAQPRPALHRAAALRHLGVLQGLDADDADRLRPVARRRPASSAAQVRQGDEDAQEATHDLAGAGPGADRRALIKRGRWSAARGSCCRTATSPVVDAAARGARRGVRRRRDAQGLPAVAHLDALPKFPVSILQNGGQDDPSRRAAQANLLALVRELHRRVPQRAGEAARPFKRASCCSASASSTRCCRTAASSARSASTSATSSPTGDLKCCILQLEMFLARYDEVPYEVLRSTCRPDQLRRPRHRRQGPRMVIAAHLGHQPSPCSPTTLRSRPARHYQSRRTGDGRARTRTSSPRCPRCPPQRLRPARERGHRVRPERDVPDVRDHPEFTAEGGRGRGGRRARRPSRRRRGISRRSGAPRRSTSTRCRTPTRRTTTRA